MESILDKVLFLLNKAEEQNCTEEEYQRIISYSSDGADGLVVGRVFGYSVSDYAIANSIEISRAIKSASCKSKNGSRDTC